MIESLAFVELSSLALLPAGIGFASSAIRLSGLFVFNSREVRQPAAQVLAAVRSIGGQAGQFLQRQYKVAA